MMNFIGASKPGVMTASPVRIGGMREVASVSRGPAAARNAPSTPAPGAKCRFAAFTTASSASVSIRPTMISNGALMPCVSKHPQRDCPVSFSHPHWHPWKN
jgi:hypothetical protein